MLLIYLAQTSSRCEYVLDFIFRQELGVEFQTTTDRNEFENYQKEKINYSSERISSEEFFIRASLLLFESEIAKQNIVCLAKREFKIFISKCG